jgi:DNA-binding NarL/FixJ family response regulator
MNVIAEASSGMEALEYIWKNKYDLILLDISMPGQNGLQTLKEIKKYDKDLPVLMLSMHAEQQYAMRAIKAGASGYMTKDTASSQLVKAIRKINDGRKYISPEVADLLATGLYHEQDKEPHEYLSDREFEVLKMIAKGDPIKIIAKNLSISPKTVSTYRSRILDKLNLETNSDIIHYAIDYKLED